MKTNLAELLNNILEKNRAKEKAFDECQYDRGYFCSREIESEQLALNAFEEALNEMIETKVTQMLNEGVTRP